MESMKGIILAGGTGSRLFPLTKITSKQLLPIYNKQMIFYPLETLKESGISEILIITDPKNRPAYEALLGDGKEQDLSISYATQEKPRGLPEAFIIAEEFIGSGPVTLILGDNIFKNSFLKEVSTFKKGARIFAKEVHDPERFGVVEFTKENRVLSIEEKPVHPKSNFAIPGIYIFDNRVVAFAKELQPSKRGELEIVDLQKKYLSLLELEAFPMHGEWVDAGTFESLLEANIWAKKNSESSNKESKEKVSVLVVTKSKDARYLDKVIFSVMKEKEVTHCVIIDNATSGDGRLEESVRNYGTRITHIRNDVATGHSEAMATGLDYMRNKVPSEYVLLLEDDTLPEEGSVKQFLDIIKRLPKKDVVLTGNRVNLKRSSDIFYQIPTKGIMPTGSFFEGISLQRINNIVSRLRGYIAQHIDSNFIYIQPVQTFLYAGTFLPMEAVKRADLPDKNLITFGDNIEYSWNIKRLGYDIFTCYNPKIYDLENKDELESLSLFDTKTKEEDVFLKIRNMVLISRRNTTQSAFFLWVNIVLWHASLFILGFLSHGVSRNYFRKVKKIVAGVYSGAKA